MNRRNFLQLGGCCAALAVWQRAIAEIPAGLPAPTSGPPTPPQASAPPLTRPEARVAFAEKWVKRFFDVLDANLDEATRTQVMQANGRACYEAAAGKGKPPTLDAFIEKMQSHAGPDSIRREGDVVHLTYTQNSHGLKTADGYCLCPLVETGPKGLSPTYCICSVGYTQHMFAAIMGHPVKVELLESLRS